MLAALIALGAGGQEPEARAWSEEELLALAPHEMTDATYHAYWGRIQDRRMRALGALDAERVESCAFLAAAAAHADESLEALGAVTERDPEALATLERQVFQWRFLAGDAWFSYGQVECLRDVEERLALLDRAWEIARVLHEGGVNRDARMIWVRIVEAQLLFEEQRPAEALELLEAELAISHQQRQHRIPAEALAANLERNLGRTTAALRRITRALAELETVEGLSPVGRSVHASMLLGHRAHVYMDLGVLDQALKANDAVQEHLRVMCGDEGRPDPTVVRDVHAAVSRTANLLYTLERYEKLLEHTERYQANDGIYGGFPGQRMELEAFRGFALAALEARDPGRPREARALLERVRGDVPSTLNQLVIDHVLADAAMEEGDLEAAATHLADGRARIAAWTERDEIQQAEVSQVALESVLARRRGAAGDELAQHLDALRERYGAALDSWARSPLRPGGLGFLYHGDRRRWISELIFLELAVHGEAGVERALEEALRGQAQGTLVRSLGGEPGSVAEVRDELVPEGGGMLVFLPAYDASHVFALDADHLVHEELAKDGELKERIARYASLVDQVLRGEDVAPLLREERRLARELSAELFPPSIDAMLESWSQVTLVGVGLFGRAPIELLPFAGGEYLATERAVAFLPGLPLGLALARRAQERAGVDLDYVLIADPDLPPDASGGRWALEPLGLDGGVLASLAAPFDPSRTVTLAHGSATRDRVLDLDLGRARLTQFLVHAVQDADRERSALLVLGADPAGAWELSCPDVDGLGAETAGGGIRSSEAVLLTACRAAQGPSRLGDDGAAHLGGAWLRAGAQVVVQSPTDLEVAATVELSRRALEALAAGATPAEALRRARADMVRSGALVSPARAGLLRVFGLGHRPLFDGPLAGVFGAEDRTSRAKAFVWLPAVLAAAALAAWALARRAPRT